MNEEIKIDEATLTILKEKYVDLSTFDVINRGASQFNFMNGSSISYDVAESF